MEIFDNVTRIVRDDLTETIKPHSRISIAAACFSIYAYQELKKQLSSVDQCRFIFTSPTFVTEKTAKEKREFYIPRLNRERSLYGTEFEVKLRNELTQKAIARECAEWIRKKATFKSNSTQEGMQGFMNVDSDGQPVTYMPINGFTTVDIGCDRGRNVYNMVNKFDAPFSSEYMKLFERIWSDETETMKGGKVVRAIDFDMLRQELSDVVVVFSPPAGTFSRYSAETLRKFDENNEIWFGKDGTAVPARKTFLCDLKNSGIVPRTIIPFTTGGHNHEAVDEVRNLLENNVFTNPKPVKLLKYLLTVANCEKDAIILDFFSGSATTAHAVMQLNAEDGGHRKFIMVQLPEPCDEKSEAYKAGYPNICEIGKERIRRAGRKVKEEAGLTASADLDIGFCCLRLDESNMQQVYYTPDAVTQQDLFSNLRFVRCSRYQCRPCMARRRSPRCWRRRHVSRDCPPCHGWPCRLGSRRSDPADIDHLIHREQGEARQAEKRRDRSDQDEYQCYPHRRNQDTRADRRSHRAAKPAERPI